MMTLNRLIEKLQAMQVEHGNAQVFVETTNEFNEIRQVACRTYRTPVPYIVITSDPD